jgi:hypothetical protein
MKQVNEDRRQSFGLMPDGPMFRERRKAYYHGKYNKRMFSLLLIVTSVAVFILNQGA